MIKITIPIQPVTKKNHGRIVQCNGKPILIPSKQYKEFEKNAGYFLGRYKNMNINKTVNVCCIYYMQTRRKVDLTNLENATLDMLVKYKVIEDDNCSIVCSMDGSRVFYDKNNPRTEITITLI